MLLRAMDIGFFIFHSGLILFILLGWAWRPLRRANLAVIALTGLSWTVLGIWYGFGYCPCTDWHWQVRAALGDTDLPWSYIKFLLDGMLGSDLDPALVDWVTVAGLIAASAASVTLNWRDFAAGKRDTRNNPEKESPPH